MIPEVLSAIPKAPPRNRSWKYGLLFLALLLLGFVGIGGWFLWNLTLRVERGEEYERKEYSFQGFDLRIRAHRETGRGLFLPGGIFVVECRRMGQDWREVHETRHDDPIPVPFRVMPLKEGVVYAVADQDFLCTWDGGAQWHVWTTYRNLAPKLLEEEYFYIKHLASIFVSAIFAPSEATGVGAKPS